MTTSATFWNKLAEKLVAPNGRFLGVPQLGDVFTEPELEAHVSSAGLAIVCGGAIYRMVGA